MPSTATLLASPAICKNTGSELKIYAQTEWLFAGFFIVDNIFRAANRAAKPGAVCSHLHCFFSSGDNGCFQSRVVAWLGSITLP